MIVRQVPVAFCFTIYWTDPDDGVAATFRTCKAAVASTLGAVARALVAGRGGTAITSPRRSAGRAGTGCPAALRLAASMI